MKRFKQILVALLSLVVLFLAYVQLSYQQTYDAPVTGLKSVRDSAVIARGRYLVYNVSHCQDCHASKKNRVAVKLGDVSLSGGDEFKTPVASFYPPNLTPDLETGIGNLSDEQIARAVRYGVKHDGTALAPFMSFNEMSDDDLTAVISYLRSAPAVYNKVPARSPNMLGKIVLRFVLKPNLEPKVAANLPADSSALYGRYLASSVGNCIGCHTSRDPMTGAFVNAPFSGGLEFREAEGTFITPNLTPDDSTGRLKGWTPELFVHRFRQGKLIPGSPMPWESFQQMTDSDLKAIYYFLKTLPPAPNRVDRTFVAKKEG